MLRLHGCWSGTYGSSVLVLTSAATLGPMVRSGTDRPLGVDMNVVKGGFHPQWAFTESTECVEMQQEAILLWGPKA